MIDKLLFLDVEATGIGDTDRLLQVAYQTRHNGQDLKVNEYFKPPVPIQKTAMAVHHVTEKHVADKPGFEASATKKELLELSHENYIFVAHNAKYDLGMLEKEGVTFKNYIDTLKIAKYLDTGQFENHQLQYLRYYYDLDIDLNGLSAHDAFADILVLNAVFWELLCELSYFEKKTYENDDALVARMVEISMNPLLLTTCNQTKHKGKSWEEVAIIDKDYLRWNLTRDNLDEDLRYTLEYYLNK